MEKRDDFYELIIFLITVFVRLIYPLIPLVVFPAYFMLKDDVNTTVEFFLCWACISILAVLVGYVLQSTSIFTSKKDSSNINYIPIYIVAIIQSLALTYLFATYQPNPDRMSQIHILSWVLFATVIHIFWIRGDRRDSPYSLIGQSFGIDSTKFTKLITVLSAFSAIGAWIAIAIIMVKQ